MPRGIMRRPRRSDRLRCDGGLIRDEADVTDLREHASPGVERLMLCGGRRAGYTCGPRTVTPHLQRADRSSGYRSARCSPVLKKRDDWDVVGVAGGASRLVIEPARVAADFPAVCGRRPQPGAVDRALSRRSVLLGSGGYE